MTLAVDWALKTHYLSICSHQYLQSAHLQTTVKSSLEELPLDEYMSGKDEVVSNCLQCIYWHLGRGGGSMKLFICRMMTKMCPVRPFLTRSMAYLMAENLLEIANFLGHFFSVTQV